MNYAAKAMQVAMVFQFQTLMSYLPEDLHAEALALLQSVAIGPGVRRLLGGVVPSMMRLVPVTNGLRPKLNST
jgi:hypothetical protein